MMSSAPPPPPYTAGEKPVYYEQGPPQPPPPVAPAVSFAQPVYIAAPVIITGNFPMQCTCPRCGNQIVTRVEKTNGLLAWLICVGLALFGFWLCCCIPFCVDGCKDTEHYCPSCSALLGVHKAL